MRLQTLTILFVDLKDYSSSTARQTHEQNANMLKAFERLLVPLFKAAEGRVIKELGDAYLVVFKTPSLAISCATAIQDRMHRYRKDAAQTKTEFRHKMHVRIALHIGEVRVRRNDVFGDPVNVAARIEAITPADEIYLSEAVYLTMNRQELNLETVGAFELKGIENPIQIYRALPAEVADGSLPYRGKNLNHLRRARLFQQAVASLRIAVLALLVGLGWCRAQQEPSAEQWYEISGAALVDGDLEDALAALHQVQIDSAKMGGRVYDLHTRVVEALLDRGSLDVAGREIELLLLAYPKDPMALMLSARHHHARDKPRAALDRLGQALKKDPKLARKVSSYPILVDGYRYGPTRDDADLILRRYYEKTDIGDALLRLYHALPQSAHAARLMLLARTEKLGASADWPRLWGDLMLSPSCSVRKAAMQHIKNHTSLATEAHIQTLLTDLSKRKECGAKLARATLAASK